MNMYLGILRQELMQFEKGSRNQRDTVMICFLLPTTINNRLSLLVNRLKMLVYGDYMRQQLSNQLRWSLVPINSSYREGRYRFAVRKWSMFRTRFLSLVGMEYLYWKKKSWYLCSNQSHIYINNSYLNVIYRVSFLFCDILYQKIPIVRKNIRNKINII